MWIVVSYIVHLKAQKLLILCDSENAKSISVAERCGFTLEAEALGVLGTTLEMVSCVWAAGTPGMETYSQIKEAIVYIFPKK